MVGILKKKRYMLFGLVIVVVIVNILQSQYVTAGVDCFDTRWPSDHSSLQPDPHLIRGTLENGFRYVIKKNHEPEKRVAIYLNVQAGSLSENDNQRGLAHFLEHMMFNGSTHFPPGSLVEYFQSIGMGFGNDTNAHTSYGETVYSLVLPDGSADKLAKGFLVIADYSRRALLLESEIERERGVILSEKRARDSAGYRAYVAHSAFAFRGTKLPERMPIGIDDTLLAANHMLLASYYNSWYRPENMVLVVVGDVEPLEVEKRVQKTFSKLLAKGRKPVCPDFGTLHQRGVEAFYHHEPEQGKTDVSIESFWGLDLQNDSLELEQREISRYVGTLIMGYRLQRIQEEDSPSFASAKYFAGDIVDRIGYGAIRAATDADHWSETLAVLDQTLRQAITFGFKNKEILRAKKEIIAGLETRVLTAKTRDSRQIGRNIIHHLNSNRVYQTPKQERDLYLPIIKRLTLDEVNREFRAVWHLDSRLVSVMGNAHLGDDGTKVILEKYKQTRATVVKPRNFRKEVDFPYLTIVSHSGSKPLSTIFPEIGVEKLIFQNGLHVNLKKTKFTENSFQMAVSFGRGKLSEPEPGMAFIAQAVINGSGSGRLTQSAIDAITAGSSVHLNFSIDDAAFSWAGGALFKDFELFIQILHTMIFDPGLRRSVFNTVISKSELMYQEMNRAIEGATALEIQPFLAHYNPRFGLPPWEKILRIGFADLQAWINTATKVKDLEISIVGDFDREIVIQTLEKYFGKSVLADPTIEEIGQIHFPRGESREVEIDTSIDKSLVVVAWPTDDSWDIKRTRRLHILANVFEDRLRKTIRETMGATYSPNCSSWGSRVYSGYGFLSVRLTVKPGMEDRVITEILKISSALHDEGPTVEELMRARNPMLTSLKDTVKNNRYWLYSVLFQSGRYPQQLEWPTDILRDYDSIDKKAVSVLAKTYLQNGEAAIITVKPKRLTPRDK